MMKVNFCAGPRRQRGQVLIALFLGGLLFGGALGGSAALFGGLTPKQLSKAINAVEPDETRRHAADEVVKSIKKSLQRLNSDRAKFDKQGLRAFKSHDTTPEDIGKLAAQADALNHESQEELLKLRFELRAHLSETQWKQVFSTPAQPD